MAPNDTQSARTARLEEQIGSLTSEVAHLRQDVKGLVDAWTTAQGVVAFVKWGSAVAAAGGVLWATFKAKILASLA